MGIGTLGPVTVLTATNALLLRFLTDNYGLAAGVAASLIAFSNSMMRSPISRWGSSAIVRAAAGGGGGPI